MRKLTLSNLCALFTLLRLFGRMHNVMAMILVENPTMGCEYKNCNNDVAMCFWWKALN